MKSEEKLGEKLRKGALVVRGGQRTPVIRHSWNENENTKSPVLVSARKLAAALWDIHPRLHHPGPHLPDSVGGLRRHVMSSLMQHYRSTEKNNQHALQPVSPVSYTSSSMEVVHYNAAFTPSSSIDFKGTNHGLKTSTELIKVLNRIWALEEQHSSNMSLLKSLKKELDHSRVRNKELTRDRKNDRHEIEDLKIQILDRKNKENDKIGSIVQSIRDELEDERKMRKRSETLHRKLARELYDVKISLANASKEAESERSSRRLLEDLCDEFALGIKVYEQEVHKLKQQYEKDLVGKTVSCDRLVLHVSESWLDERMQTKLGENMQVTSVVDKMSSEIQSFLRARREDSFVGKGDMVKKSPKFRRSSLESTLINTAISAPQHIGDDEESDVSDSNCFELSKPGSSGVKPCEENQNNDGLNYETVKKDEELNIQKGKSEICEVIEKQGSEEEVNGVIDKKNLAKTNHIMDDFIRSRCCQDSNFVEAEWGRNASPIRQWTPKLPSQHRERYESPTTRLPLDLRENTLKAKLLDARTRGQRSRSRLKGRKISF